MDELQDNAEKKLIQNRIKCCEKDYPLAFHGTVSSFHLKFSTELIVATHIKVLMVAAKFVKQYSLHEHSHFRDLNL